MRVGKHYGIGLLEMTEGDQVYHYHFQIMEQEMRCLGKACCAPIIHTWWTLLSSYVPFSSSGI